MGHPNISSWPFFLPFDVCDRVCRFFLGGVSERLVVLSNCFKHSVVLRKFVRIVLTVGLKQNRSLSSGNSFVFGKFCLNGEKHNRSIGL